MMLTFDWFRPTSGDGRAIYGRGHGRALSASHPAERAARAAPARGLGGAGVAGGRCFARFRRFRRFA